MTKFIVVFLALLSADIASADKGWRRVSGSTGEPMENGGLKKRPVSEAKDADDCEMVVARRVQSTHAGVLDYLTSRKYLNILLTNKSDVSVKVFDPEGMAVEGMCAGSHVPLRYSWTQFTTKRGPDARFKAVAEDGSGRTWYSPPLTAIITNGQFWDIDSDEEQHAVPPGSTWGPNNPAANPYGYGAYGTGGRFGAYAYGDPRRERPAGPGECIQYPNTRATILMGECRHYPIPRPVVGHVGPDGSLQVYGNQTYSVQTH